MSTVVIMPGGFHPFHAGHLALYQSAQRAFPDAEVFVAATNDTSERPFPFAVKEKLARLAGVSPNNFYQVKSPFRAEEITKNFNPEKDHLIFVRSEKDADQPPRAGGIKKDGSPAYLQPLLGAKKLDTFNKHAYMAYLPTVEFGPGMTSATEIRRAWPQLDDRRRKALVMSLYPVTQKNPELVSTVIQMLNVAIQGTAGSAVDENQGWAATLEENPDYIEEKWSAKYKRSINCANPQGFSQRAHCAGRRKNEGVAEGDKFVANKNHEISASVDLPKWKIGLPVFVKHLGQKGTIDSLSSDSAIVSVGMRQHRVKLSDLNRYPSKGVVEGLNEFDVQGFQQRYTLYKDGYEIEKFGNMDDAIEYAEDDRRDGDDTSAVYKIVDINKQVVWDSDPYEKPSRIQLRKPEQGVEEAQLAEKCWDTHRQAGMKKKGNRMVPNCVPKESQ